MLPNVRGLNELLYGTGKHLDRTKDNINVKPVEKAHNKQRADIDVKDTNSNYNDGKAGLSIDFVNKLLRYIDTVFPTETDLNQKVSSELRNYVKVGDGSELKRAKRKVCKIVYDDKSKLLDRLETRLLKVLVAPK